MWPPPRAGPRAEARGGCPSPRATRTFGGEGLAQKSPRKKGRKRKRRISSRPLWPSAAPLALAEARNELATEAVTSCLLGGFPNIQGGNLELGMPGFCLEPGAATTLASRAVLTRPREAQKGWGFWLGYGGCSIERAVIRPRGFHERKVFRGESDGQKRPKKEKPSKAMPRK